MTSRPAACGIMAVTATVVLYAVFSSPTPDAPGAVEYAILALLALAACCAHWPRDAWAPPLGALVLYGLSVPLALGVFWGHAPGDIVRDIVAFMALAVPLVFAALVPPDDPRAGRVLLGLLLGTGLVFSFRYLAAPNVVLGALGLRELDHNLLYLANSPLVPFAACWLLLRGCFSEPRPWLAVALAVAALVPLAAMVGMMQRATLALLALAWLGFFLGALVRAPLRAFAVAGGAALLVLLLWPLPALIWDALAGKTFAVGWNARGAEIAAIVDSLAGHPVTALFGAGWGALVKSPAVGELWVSFSHGLFSALLWKAGWPGLALGAAAMAALVLSAARRLRGDPVTLAALVLPLLPALFLYGSYKSLCFGLLLLGLARLNWTKGQAG